MKVQIWIRAMKTMNCAINDQSSVTHSLKSRDKCKASHWVGDMEKLIKIAIELPDYHLAAILHVSPWNRSLCSALTPLPHMH